MRIEIVAVGTELLLGQIADTNSAWLGEELAAAGIDSQFHQAVGDHPIRIVLALRTALARSDGVIVCGGLGPTQDDITREAIAEVMNVPLVRDEVIVQRISRFFTDRGREMSENNARQADVPAGAAAIDQARGTAPGLICPVGNKVIYAVPGVPYEMSEMFERAILPDLRSRVAGSGDEAVIRSRVLRTWGTSESGLAEALGDRIVELDRAISTAGDTGAKAAPTAAKRVTLAFLASGMEGIKVRITARAPNDIAAIEALDAEEGVVRAVLAERVGDIVFGIDDETMEQIVGDLLLAHGLTLAVAESLTGGLIASRLVGVVGASRWFRGGVVAYASEVKHDVLGVQSERVVCEEAAGEMATGVCRELHADVGIGITGVAGPDTQEGVDPGTVHIGIVLPKKTGAPWKTGLTTVTIRLPGDRDRIRQYAAISSMDLLRRALVGTAASVGPEKDRS